MKHLHRFDCSKMTKEETEEHIKSFVDCGWNFDGYSDFPPPHVWVCLSWLKDEEPVYPNQVTHT